MTAAAQTMEGEVSWKEAVQRVHREGNVKSRALGFDKKKKKTKPDFLRDRQWVEAQSRQMEKHEPSPK